MPQPVLTTERLVLTPLAERHLPLEIELDADPQVMRYLGNGRPRAAREVTELHRRRVAVSVDAPGFGFWAGTVDGEPVGWWLLEPPTRDEHAAVPQGELGYRLLPSFWRRGLATEGSVALVAYAFEALELQRVFAETMAVNAGSRAVMAGLGMRHVRTFHEVWDEPIAGAEHGEVEYAITRAEWLSRSGPGRRGPA